MVFALHLKADTALDVWNGTASYLSGHPCLTYLAPVLPPHPSPSCNLTLLDKLKRFFFCSVSSGERNQSYATEWSDEESNNPFASDDVQGESNPFDEEVSPTLEVRVRALYDYEGQEHDELSFKTGKCSSTFLNDVFPALKVTWKEQSPTPFCW